MKGYYYVPLAKNSPSMEEIQRRIDAAIATHGEPTEWEDAAEIVYSVTEDCAGEDAPGFYDVMHSRGWWSLPN